MASAERTTTEDAQRAAAFRVALRRFARETERTARRAGLTPQRYLLLLLVKGAEDGSERATISDLAKRLCLAQSTVTELVNRAGEAGLVARRASASDARVVYVELTAEGEQRFSEAFRALADERRSLRDVITGI